MTIQASAHAGIQPERFTGSRSSDSASPLFIPTKSMYMSRQKSRPSCGRPTPSPTHTPNAIRTHCARMTLELERVRAAKRTDHISPRKLNMFPRAVGRGVDVDLCDSNTSRSPHRPARRQALSVLGCDRPLCRGVRAHRRWYPPTENSLCDPGSPVFVCPLSLSFTCIARNHA